MPKRKPVDQIDALVTLREDLSELITEARGVLKDLQAERRACQEMTKGLHARVEREIGEQIREGLEQYSKTLNRAVDKGRQRILERFQTLEDTLLGTDRRARAAGLPALPEIVTQISSVVDKMAAAADPSSVPPRR